MRGEDFSRRKQLAEGSGSPPHARGRRVDLVVRIEDLRITPACAGKTRHRAVRLCQNRDHPRMRGEDLYDAVVKLLKVGSPPHARGRQSALSANASVQGITPACAGKTRCQNNRLHCQTDHPRMRGEDRPILRRRGLGPGSPPHARGRPGQFNGARIHRWITPACAGKTPR